MPFCPVVSFPGCCRAWTCSCCQSCPRGPAWAPAPLIRFAWPEPCSRGAASSATLCKRARLERGRSPRGQAVGKPRAQGGRRAEPRGPFHAHAHTPLALERLYSLGQTFLSTKTYSGKVSFHFLVTVYFFFNWRCAAKLLLLFISFKREVCRILGGWAGMLDGGNCLGHQRPHTARRVYVLCPATGCLWTPDKWLPL